MKAAVITVLVVAVVAGAVLWLTQGGGAPPKPAAGGTYTVKRQVLRIALSEKGTLKAKNSTRVLSQASAKIEWIVDEGKQVEKDEILIELDKKETRTQLDQLANQVTQLEAELKSATTEEVIQVDQNKTDIEKAELALAVAEVEVKKLLEADIPSEERKLKLAIEEKEVALQDAKDNLKAYLELHKEDFATAHDVHKAELELKRADNDLTTARLDWDSFVAFKQPLDRRKKEAELEEARRGLDRAKKRAEAQLAAKQAMVQQKKVSLQRVQQQHEQTAKQIEGMTIKAPTAGTVLYGDQDNPWNNEQIKVGGQVWQNMCVITLPDAREMNAVVEIHEADIAEVKKDMVAFVISETRKDVVYEGKVTKIDTVANAGQRWWGGDDVKRFKVEVELQMEGQELKPGTSARVEIQVGEVADALAVPLQAIFPAEGKHYVFRANGGKPERVEVEPGRSNESHVEVKSGLEEGDVVLLTDPGVAEGDAPKGAPGS